MHRFFSSPTFHVFFCLLPTVLILSGCGTGEYERRLAKRASQIQTESKYNDLYAPQDLPGVPVSVRVPVQFTESPLVEGVADKDGNPVDPRRIKPMGVDIPGLILTYEGFKDNPAGGKLSYYCYVGAADMAAAGIQNPSAAISAALAAKGVAANWTDFQGESPDGRTVPWRNLHFSGNQEFYTLGQDNAGNFSPLPGVLDIYLHEENGILLLMAWRAPADIEPQVDSTQWATLMGGCFTIKK